MRVPVARVEGGPEVHHLDLDGALRRREEDVLRLEVGVDDGPLVDVADRVEELPRHVLQHRQGEGRVPGPAAGFECGTSGARALGFTFPDIRRGSRRAARKICKRGPGVGRPAAFAPYRANRPKFLGF